MLSKWSALTFAIQNNWGGPNGSDKRDWLAGALSDIFLERPETDAIDVEEILLQALQDEFGVDVDDESEVGVASQILALRKETLEGNFSSVDAMQERWVQTKGKEVVVTGVLQGQHSDDEDDEDNDEVEDDDVDMAEAPQLISVPRERSMPEVDEDGFTKVVGKKNR